MGFTAFAAKYGGRCGKCGASYGTGAMIYARRGGHAYHAACTENGNRAQREVAVGAITGEKGDEMKEEKIILPTTKTPGGLAETLAAAVEPYIKIKGDDIRAELDGRLTEIEERIKSIRVPLTVDVRRSGGETERIDGVHRQFPALLKLVQAGMNVYMHGAPGGGKSTAAGQVAKALGRGYGHITLMPTTTESKVFGFIDAQGRSVETVFTRGYVGGDVVCMEEVDNSSPMIQAFLNTCLENGHASLPWGMAARGETFALIATGNTCGRGATLDHQERRTMDAGFADRFVFLKWEYDETLEDTVTAAINPLAGPWVEWVRRVRNYADAHHPRLKATPRASFNGARLLREGFAAADAAEMVVFKGVEAAVMADVLRNCPLPSGAMVPAVEAVL